MLVASAQLVGVSYWSVWWVRRIGDVLEQHVKQRHRSAAADMLLHVY